jgi:fructoselysine-6-P-deglycase FrlB-like protein
MNTRPTPETDAVIFHRDNGVMRDHPFVVTADFARNLERELNTVTAQRDRLAEALKKAKAVYTPSSGGQYQTGWHDAIKWIEYQQALQSLTPTTNESN